MKNGCSNLISVIVPTYNREKTILFALESIYNQSHRPIEVVIIDDGSTDNTEEVVKNWVNVHETPFFHINYLYQKNAGATSARNHGLKKAKGEYIQFFDSDDFLKSRKLELQLKSIKNKNSLISICDYDHVDENRKIIKTMSNNRSLNDLISSFSGKHTSIGLIDNRLFRKYHLMWNPKIINRDDTDLYTKIFMVVSDFSYVDMVLFQWIRHKGERISNSYKLTKEAYWGLLKSAIWFNIKNIHRVSVTKYPALIQYYCFLINKTKTGYYLRRIQFWKTFNK